MIHVKQLYGPPVLPDMVFSHGAAEQPSSYKGGQGKTPHI